MARPCKVLLQMCFGSNEWEVSLGFMSFPICLELCSSPDEVYECRESTQVVGKRKTDRSMSFVGVYERLLSLTMFSRSS